MPKFYRNRRYVNKKGQQFGKGVWVDDYGNIIYPGQSRMAEGSRETRTVTQYNSDGTKTVYPWEEWAKKSQREHEIRVLQNDRKYAIPYIPEKKMTITIDEDSPTRRMAGATFSENLLDSIAVNAKEAGLPFSTAIGLVAQESTFGKGKRGAGRSMLPWDRMLNASSGDVKDKAKAISYTGYYSPSLLISNWKQRQEGPFYDYFYNEKGTLLEKPKDSQFYDEDINSARIKANKYHLVDESPLKHGFRKYEENPEEWNHNNPNYRQEVAEKSYELVNYSPEIRTYMKENHLHAGGGSLEQPLPWNRLSLSEKAEVIKNAVGNGVYNLRDIKSTYSTHVEGDSYACGGHLFKRGGKQGSSSSLAQKAMLYFVGKGLTQEQAAGLVGNLQRESGLNYQAVNPNGGAVGIAQWLGSRKKKLYERYGKNPTFDDQLDYVWYELNTTHKNGLKKLKESKTVDDAAMNAFGYYEFSAGPAAAIRSMNSHGMNTKWKNGDGSTAMTRGIINGRKLLGATPFIPSKSLEVPQVSALPQFLFGSNPTDYGTPVDYSTPVKPVVEDMEPSPVEERQNGWEILNLLQGLGAPQQATQPLASYQSLAENSSPYVVGVPSASTTMLDASWFVGGGPLGGGYSDWKKAIAEYKGIHPDEDNTYDYERYYKRYPAQAWAMLDNDPEVHFVDEFKTIYHPSFSNQSKYSGIVDTRYNPEGIIGGTWSEDGRSYTLSEDQARHRWDIGNTMNYFSGAEDNGVEGFYPDGRHWTTAEGDIWGGVLPAVEITPDKYSNGGYLFGEGGTRTHSFTYDTPVKYNGASYPASSMIVDGKEMQVFAGGDGSLWSIGDNGKPQSVIYQHELPEVVISPAIKSQQENIQKMQRDYSTLSNDATAIYTGKLLNPHLTDRTIAGAKSHAAWEKGHPNLAAWSYAAGAVPFAIASAPIVVGLGDMTAGTTIGQGITNSLTAMTNTVQGSTWMPWVDAAATSYFGAHGVNEIAQGNMNPEAVLETAPLLQAFKPLTYGNQLRNVWKNSSATSVDKMASGYSGTMIPPLKGVTEIPVHIKAEAAKKYINFVNSEDYLNRLQKANLSTYWDYMKELTNRRLNNAGYFPGYVKPIIKNNPQIMGTSSVEPTSSNYGVTLQEGISSEEIFPTLFHELSHWATGNAGINDRINAFRYPFKNDYRVNAIGDIMRYNESIAPTKEWDAVLKDMPSTTPISDIIKKQEDYEYLVDPQEIRARLYSIYQQAKDRNVPLDSFVDMYSNNGKIIGDAPMELRQLGDIFTVGNLKKRLNKFLAIPAFIGVGSSLMNNSSNSK